MDQRKDQYFKQDRDPQLLYQGTQETIVKELKAWVVRRKEVIKEQMELRNKSQKSTKELISSAVKAADPGQMRIFLERNARAKVLDDEANDDTARAAYLLETLKSRGFAWPELWWQPDADGGV